MRKSLPIADWPEADRLAWERATLDGDLFDERGPAARWSEIYRANVRYGYGRWLAYLGRTRRELAAAPPGQRVTLDWVRNYVLALQSEVTSMATLIYVERLYSALRVMEPGCDWAWLGEMIARLNAAARPRDKRPRMVDADRLFALGLRLMDEDAECGNALDQAIRMRDGLIIALLAARPIRLRNLAAIEIDRHLVVVGAGYDLVFGADEMKNRRPLEFGLPQVLVAPINRYLTTFRSVFPGAESHRCLWASAKGRPMGRKAVYDRICLRTRVAFGRAINPHLFRDCVATTIATWDPAHIEIARDILGHNCLETTERYYNQARMIEAGRHYHEIVGRARARAKPLARTPSRRRR